MNIQIMVGGIRFRFDSDFEIKVEESLTPFLFAEEQGFDICVKMICHKPCMIKPQGQKCGEDLLLEYYQQDEQIVCCAKGSSGRYLSTTICDSSFENMNCYLHFMPEGKMQLLGVLLRLLPMCAALQQKNVLFFHASQIEMGGTGILFTAPSGTGKTTQAKLWKTYRGANMVCNDRTLICGNRTYGFPIDGSEPVRSGEIHKLGAIVLLEQKEVDVIQRLKPKEAVFRLLPQLIFTVWDPSVKVMVIEQLIALTTKYPVYLLSCTQKESAVQCLEKQLEKDGVM